MAVYHWQDILCFIPSSEWMILIYQPLQITQGPEDCQDSGLPLLPHPEEQNWHQLQACEFNYLIYIVKLPIK